MKLIKTVAALTAAITAFGKQYAAIRGEAHRLFVSALLHVAEHGNITPLSTFYDTLPANDQLAFGYYIKRVFAVLGGWDGTTIIPTEEMEKIVAKGQFFIRKNKAFHVIPNVAGAHVKAMKAACVTLCNDRLTKPDGKVFKPFLERSIFAEQKTFGNDELKSGLDKLLQAATGQRKNTTSAVSAKYVDALRKAQSIIGEPINSLAI